MLTRKRILRTPNGPPNKKIHNTPVCLVCSKTKDIRKNNGMRQSGDDVLQKLLVAAEEREDWTLYGRVAEIKQLKTENRNARHHISCYKKYTSKHSVTAVLPKEQKSERVYQSTARALLAGYRERLQKGELFLLTAVTEDFCAKMNFIKNYSTTSAYVKRLILEVAEGEIVFHSLGNGKPDIMCSAELSVGEILTTGIRLLSNASDEVCAASKKPVIEHDDETSCLFRAAKIIQKLIADIPATEKIPKPADCDFEGSRSFSLQFAPCLVNFFAWIVSENAEDCSFDVNELNECDERRVYVLSEMLVYSSRRKTRNQVIPPLQMGLAMQLAYESQVGLLHQLHAFGMCVSYDEFRRSVTALADHEISGHDTEYVPKALVSRKNGGALIQEGDDNVDMNTETVNGKNDYHVMGRVYFQLQLEGQGNEVACLKRGKSTRKSIDIINKNEHVRFKVYPFRAPSTKPEPKRYASAWSQIESLLTGMQKLTPHDALWAVLRGTGRGLLTFSNTVDNVQAVPFWAGFNTRMAESRVAGVTTVCYAPAINAKPADPATVYTTLRRGKSVAAACGQPYSVHTMDQQLYAVAQVVKWACGDELTNSHLRLGGFHAQCTFIACIGKLWGTAGLVDMLVNSGTFGPNTAEHMMQGKQYYRAVRGLTIAYEALTYLLFENFQAWLLESYPEKLREFTIKAAAAFQGYAAEDWRGTQVSIFSNFLDRLSDLLNKFTDLGRKSMPTFSFWIDCLYALQTLLDSIRGDREGDWDLHLRSMAEMTVLYFSCDRTNYSRWSPLYLMEMLNDIPEDLKHSYNEGHHSVRFTKRYFNGRPKDLATEETIIKDSKSDSGYKGFQLRDGSVLRWEVTRHIVGAFRRAMRGRSDYSRHSHAHEQEGDSFFRRDDSQVQHVVDHIKTYMTDPFSAAGSTENLVHIGSGLLATPDVQENLLTAVEKGRKEFEIFVKSRLEEVPEGTAAALFHSTLHKTQLKTFADMQKTSTFSANGKAVKKAISAVVVLERAQEIKKVRGNDFDLDEVLRRPLTSVPPALFNGDGTRRTTNKAKLMHSLEEMFKPPCTEDEDISPGNDHIIHILDAMALLQKMNVKAIETYGDVARSVIKCVLKTLENAKEVHLVFDRYDDEVTPKSLERRRRYGCVGNIFEIMEHRKIQNWDKVMSSDENKSALTNFLSKYIAKNVSNEIPDGKRLYLGGGYSKRTECTVVTNNALCVAPEYSCNHSEADTRMIFHAIQSSRTTSVPHTIVIESPDTDVLLLLVAHFSRLSVNARLLFRTGVSDSRRDILVDYIANSMEMMKRNSTRALLAVHSVTGNDTCCALYYIGKASALTVMLNCMSEEELHDLSQLGSNTPESVKAATKFISRLYDPKGKLRDMHNSINSLRSKMAMRQTTADRLPPSEPELKCHLLRASWQTYVHVNAHDAMVEGKDPLDYGWFLENDMLQPMCFSGPSALELLQEYICNCGGRNPCSGQDSSACPCVKKGFKCCELCVCSKTCVNKSNEA